MRTLPSGNRVAVCPERGASISAPAVSEPSVVAPESALQTAIAMATEPITATTRASDKRKRTMAPSSKIETISAYFCQHHSSDSLPDTSTHTSAEALSIDSVKSHRIAFADGTLSGAIAAAKIPLQQQ